MIENQHIEFKQMVTPELEREVVAFLNSNEGGVIYVGINKKGTVVGIEDIDQAQLLIKMCQTIPSISSKWSRW